MVASSATLFTAAGFHGETLHSGASFAALDPLTVRTPPLRWAYALSCALPSDLIAPNGLPVSPARLVLDLVVQHGRIGIGITNPDGTAFLEERYVPPGPARVTLGIDAGTAAGRLVIRNAAVAGGPSEVAIRGVRVDRVKSDERRYPGRVSPRQFDEAIVAGGTTDAVFDTPAAAELNAARRAWLETSGLPVEGARVLDAGCGVGHFISFYTSRGCQVVALDGREENIAELRRRHPQVEAHVGDIQQAGPSLGRFDVVHCFGLLYHLDSPIAALRNLARLCRRLLLIETMVCDSSRPLALLADETNAASQALNGLGVRPSPSFVVLAANRVGFRYIYGARQAPRHPEFEFEWLDNLDTTRAGHPLRAIFVASRTPLDSSSLVPLLEG